MQSRISGRILFPASLLLTLFLLEGSLRISGHESTFRNWYWNSLTYLTDPEVDWKLEPKTYAYGQINRFHFRGPEIAPEKSNGVYRIFLLGGSAAFDLWKKDNETWAVQLENDLKGTIHNRIEVLNAATPGYSSWQAYNLMKTKLVRWHPDLVLLYELYNDSLTFTHNDRQAIINGWKLNGQANFAGWFSQPHSLLDFPSRIFPATVDFIRMTGVKHYKKRADEKNNQFWSNPRLDSKLQEAGFSFYEENRKSLARFLNQNGNIPLGIVSQISLIRQNNTAEEIAQIHYTYRGLNHEQLWNAYQRARGIDRKVCSEEPNAFFIPASEAIPATLETMIDEVHLNHRGGALLAHFIATELNKRGIISDGPVSLQLQ